MAENEPVSRNRRATRFAKLCFGKDGFRTSIFVPVVVNLTTAFLLFAIVAIFKGQIYERLMPPKVTGFPLYCLTDGYNNEKGEIVGEVYIINRTAEQLDEAKLIEQMKRDTDGSYITLDASIRIKWMALPAQFTVEEDGKFNNNKGKLRVTAPENGNGDWSIHVEKIADRAIMRVLVSTTVKRTQDRGSGASLPFSIVYRGE